MATRHALHTMFSCSHRSDPSGRSGSVAGRMGG